MNTSGKRFISGERFSAVGGLPLRSLLNVAQRAPDVLSELCRGRLESSLKKMDTEILENEGGGQ